MDNLKIAVVGAGVVGATTAVELQKLFRNANVHIIADKFDIQTTSDVAAGVFRPGTSFAGPNEDITRKWIIDSYNYWDDIKNTREASKAGVAEISGYIFSSTHPGIVRNHYIEKLVPVYRAATEDELSLCPGNWKYGSFFTTLLTSCSLYLPWAYANFRNAGGRTIQKEIGSLSSFGAEYDVVVNCTGLGAKYLCNDYKLVPIRGQVLKVEAPWLKTFFYGDYDTYIVPGFDSVTLGGCRQYDSYDCAINRYDGLAIKERCETLVPSLRGAKIITQRVGLRPHRDPVRVEKDVHNRVKIVHNYGHGGYGVTTAPGTARYACSLVRELLLGNSKL
ncbi:hypothetical protein NQ315_006197 [Exocentrus adspersus]|uniref:FAD dependent oxidoreductase domain-containing protein n=1 Tax=Exocentrus adspersus TaxID=1586481 RepID=A0AAV8VZJ5_9CUCU|nr:hypothetical protein NQ315_006197 [Exocentrus adspersus]